MQLDRASAGSAPVATSIYSQTRNRGYTLIPSNEKGDDGGDYDSPNRIMHSAFLMIFVRFFRFI
jgi:hypothetical protein